MKRYRITWKSWAKGTPEAEEGKVLGYVWATCPEQACNEGRREFGPIGNNQIIEAEEVK